MVVLFPHSVACMYNCRAASVSERSEANDRVLSEIVLFNVSLSRSNLGNPLAALMYCELWFPDQLATYPIVYLALYV